MPPTLRTPPLWERAATGVSVTVAAVALVATVGLVALAVALIAAWATAPATPSRTYTPTTWTPRPEPSLTYGPSERGPVWCDSPRGCTLDSPHGWRTAEPDPR